MVEGVMVVDQRHIVRMVNDELLNLFDLKQSRWAARAGIIARSPVEMIVRETILRGEPRQQEVCWRARAGASRVIST